MLSTDADRHACPHGRQRRRRLRRLAAFERLASLARRFHAAPTRRAGQRFAWRPREIIRRTFAGLVRESSLDAVVLLAHERVHDPDGTPREDLGSMFVPNDVVLDLAEAASGISRRRFHSPGATRCARRTGALPRGRRRVDEMSAELPEHRLLRYALSFRFGNEWRRRGCRCSRTPAANTPSR